MCVVAYRDKIYSHPVLKPRIYGWAAAVPPILVIAFDSLYILVVLILWRHILRVHIVPFIAAFLLLMFIFLLQYLMKSLDQLVGKGLSAGVISELIVVSLAWMVVLAVPMAVLIATLMAFGGLASTNQITAMRASGMSLYSMMMPVLLASCVVCFFLVKFDNDVLPDANHKVKVLTIDISRKKPTLTLVPGLFEPLMQGRTILVRKTFEHSNDLEGVTILDSSDPLFYNTITAERGRISFSPDYRKLIMDLEDGEIHQLSVRDFQEYRKIRFTRHRISMDAEGFSFQRSQESAFSRGDREMSADAMRIIVDSLRHLQDRSRERIQAILNSQMAGVGNPSKMTPTIPRGEDFTPYVASSAAMLRNTLQSEFLQLHYFDLEAKKYLVEIHKKYSIPVACIVFVLVGAPLGIIARRGTFGVGASLSLGFFLLYWACLIGGEKLADRGLIEPWVGMWTANIVIGIMGAYLTYRTARESPTIDWSVFTRFVPKSWRSNAEGTGAHDHP